MSLLTVPVDAVSAAVNGAVTPDTPTLVGCFVTAVRAAAFWTAVFLPMLYLPMLFVGSSGPVAPSAVGKFVCVHVAALVVGHVYDGVVGTLRRP